MEEIAQSVQVYDDFFPRRVQSKVMRLMQRPKWSFTGGKPPNQFWHMNDLETETYFTETLFGLICERLDRQFAGFERIYANGQTALQVGTPHIDDGDVTFLYYANPIWEPAWNGSLLFLDDKARIAHRVEYQPNRGILFPAELVHYAEAPSESFTGLRVSLAYKLLLAANGETG